MGAIILGERRDGGAYTDENLQFLEDRQPDFGGYNICYYTEKLI